jgi:pimeloyl-ACP methyl ester carboxylesterase
MAEIMNAGVRIHYEVEGNGPPLILQHGFSQSLADWRIAGYVAALRDHRRLILVDARGHGNSDKPHEAAAYTVDHYAADIVAVLDALNLERADYWGYSMGGWIGFGMAKHAPERLRALILGRRHAYGRTVPQGLPDGRDPECFFTSFFSSIGLDFAAQPAEQREALLGLDTLALAAARQGRPSLEHLLPTMTIPTLLYAGVADSVFAQVEKSAKAISNCAFVAVPGFDHSDTFYKATIQLVPKVLDFLKRRRGRQP